MTNAMTVRLDEETSREEAAVLRAHRRARQERDTLT
jgi:hypothetical protein